MTECPTPHKRSFTTRAEARRYSKRALKLVKSGAKRRGRHPVRTRPYHCACGAWHLSGQSETVTESYRQRAAAGY